MKYYFTQLFSQDSNLFSLVFNTSPLYPFGKIGSFAGILTILAAAIEACRCRAGGDFNIMFQCHRARNAARVAGEWELNEGP